MTRNEQRKAHALAVLAAQAGPDGWVTGSTMRHLAGWLEVSPATARRRLAELETAGDVEALEHPGCWIDIRLVDNPSEAARAASRYATEGRRRCGGKHSVMDPPVVDRLECSATGTSTDLGPGAVDFTS